MSNPRKRIKACGINFADVAVRLGLYQAAKGAYPLCR
jgi:NADPH:quinone reductase-like Zn-dependent oxidoreductase